MKNILKLLFIYLISIYIPCFSQTVITKDGVSIGKRSEAISDCIKGYDKSIKINGLEVDPYKYCACVLDNLIPTINSWEIQKAAKENKLQDLLLSDKNLQILMKCLEGNSKITQDFDYKFEQSDNLVFKKSFIKNCINQILNNEESKILMSKESAEQYCDCAFNKLVSAGYTYKDLLQIVDKNSSTFNEIAVPCLSEIFKINQSINPSNLYNISDIKGEKHFSIVPLIDYLGKGYKVKISIAGVSKYYYFDTGASDLIIDRDTERELLLNGTLKKENYLNKSVYTLANGETIISQKVKVDNIVIGDYTLNNVVIGIIDNGLLLCGKSLLEKFTKWEIDTKKNNLILYK